MTNKHGVIHKHILQIKTQTFNLKHVLQLKTHMCILKHKYFNLKHNCCNSTHIWFGRL